MPGASEQTRRVKVLNANWVAGPDGADGQFHVQIVTEDDQRHVLEPSPAAMAALVALGRADTVLAWDPTNRTLGCGLRAGTRPSRPRQLGGECRLLWLFVMKRGRTHFRR
jgi:hypothetical protein